MPLWWENHVNDDLKWGSWTHNFIKSEQYLKLVTLKFGLRDKRHRVTTTINIETEKETHKDKNTTVILQNVRIFNSNSYFFTHLR